MAGYKDGLGMLNKADDLLASTKGLEPISIVIKAGTADAGNLEGTEILRKGLVLVQFTSGVDLDKYTNHNSLGGNGVDDETNAVVLGQRIDMGDQSSDVPAAAYFRGSFNEGALIVDDSANFDWTAVQRLRRR